MNYGHGDDLYRYLIPFNANFSSNVWYKGPPEKLLLYLRDILPRIKNYPEPSAEQLSQIIAIHHQVVQQQLIVTNGATEAFYIIANAFRRKTATITTPTFSEYERACTVHDIKTFFSGRKDIVNTVFKTSLVFVCNPNNPDGFSNTPQEIADILQKHPDIVFVIDEAYIDFTHQTSSCVSLLAVFNNLIIVKSMTKLFGIPGLRLGYIITNQSLAEQIHHCKIPWSANSMAIAAGTFIFEQYTDLYPDVEEVLRYSETLQRSIDRIEGFHVTPSATHYFLVRLDRPLSTVLKAYLVTQHQLLIRDASNFKGLDAHYIRIAAQDPDKNTVLIKALKSWTKR